MAPHLAAKHDWKEVFLALKPVLGMMSRRFEGRRNAKMVR